MPYVVAFARLAFQKHKLDDEGNPTVVPDGDEEIVTKGYPVPDYVQEAELQALMNSGMIFAVGDAPKPAPAEEVGPPAPAEDPAPKPLDSRATWEAFAVDKELFTEDEASSFPNKNALIDAVNAKLGNK